MARGPEKIMGAGCLGGLIGAILGISIGGFVGPLIATSSSVTRHNSDPLGDGINGLFDGCLAFFGAWLGMAAGGIIGGIGGSVLGAGMATKTQRRPADAAVPKSDSPPVPTPEPPTESSSIELTRLKERIAEIERKKRRADGAAGLTFPDEPMREPD